MIESVPIVSKDACFSTLFLLAFDKKVRSQMQRRQQAGKETESEL